MGTPDRNDDKINSSEKASSTNPSLKTSDSEKYFMKIAPPKMIDTTIIIKPPSKGGVEEGRKDSLSKRVKGVEESIKHGLHLDNKDK
jgi:hypothetical protein